MELVTPSAKYRDSYIAAKEEDGSISDAVNQDGIEKGLIKKDFPAFVASLIARADGRGLPAGYVADTRLWLVDGEEYIGSATIRHSLTPHLLQIGGHIGYNIRPSKRKMGYGNKILALALPKAKELGIDRVLLTCDETNIGSRKIIEANGGVLENKVPNPDGGPDKLRFWIQT